MSCGSFAAAAASAAADVVVVVDSLLFGVALRGNGLLRTGWW